VFRGAFWVMLVYRFGVWSLGVRWPPGRWVTGKVYGALQRAAVILTGISLHRTARLSKGFHIVGRGMIYIHPDVVVGARCGLMHYVTLGTNMGDGVPTLGDDVFLGCGASVLGNVTIGNGARIAANSLVITDVPTGGVAIGVPAQVVGTGWVRPRPTPKH
jgi:serine O-acetyltransferase